MQCVATRIDERATWALSLFARPWTKARPAVVLSAGSAESGIYCKLQRDQRYEVLFFIDEEPWNHRTTIGNAQLRYPSVLTALCENDKIAAVFYCDDKNAEKLPKLRYQVIRVDA